ncbi:uncharacterized protein LOC115450180 [Manduca sexta]|uniref:uncharacterized protein LOC115450180 n=1 Tax=Manduca sexta TaxID=7130 RepID=UPI00189041FB|nr:uncharacterized protein LOC115450180 [Manduca sexta]
MDRIGSRGCNVSSLDTMYTDFDGWTRRFTQMYRRSTHFPAETRTTIDKAECIDNRLILLNIHNILLNGPKKPHNEIYSNDYLYHTVFRFVNDNQKKVYICKLCLFVFLSSHF